MLSYLDPQIDQMPLVSELPPRPWVPTRPVSNPGLTFANAWLGSNLGTPAPAPATSITTSPSTAQSAVPASPGDPGQQGDIRFDSGHVYVCVARDTWKRAALVTW